MPSSNDAVDIKQLEDMVNILPIDGAWPEPYSLPVTEGNCFIVAKDKKALELFNQLPLDKKKEFLYNSTYSVYGDILGCDPIHMFFVWDNAAYYTGDMSYEEKASDVELLYYKRGMPVNVVKQYKDAFNYKDYYKLSTDEQNQKREIGSLESKEQDITLIDLNKQNDFICNVGPVINNNYDDTWNMTIGTEYIPAIKMIDKAYRNQRIAIIPLFANFTLDKNNKGKVTYKVTIKYPNGSEKTIPQTIIAIDGKVMPKQIIQSQTIMEYVIDDTDDLGIYTFTVESKDEVGNKTATNTFKVEFTDYKYVKNSFKTDDKVFDYIENYYKNPDPTRITDAVVFAEETGIIEHPVLLGAFSEILAKNQFLIKLHNEEINKRFGDKKSKFLEILDVLVKDYVETLSKENLPYAVVRVMDKSEDDYIFAYHLGVFMSSGSYKAAKLLASALENNNAKDSKLSAYYKSSVPVIEKMIFQHDLFKAYCTYMALYDDTVSQNVNTELKKLLKL